MFVRFGLALFAAFGLAGNPAQAQNPISVRGVTLTSVSAAIPEGNSVYPGGAAAQAINANCVACHSTAMVLMQPNMNEATWKAEVAKMRAVFKAPVDDADIPAIVAYLVQTKGAK